MDTVVIKASGRSEKFDIDKLAESLVRAGAPPDIAVDIAGKVASRISPSAHSKAIYRMARTLLRQYNRVSGMKYSLKKALYALGPSGYPFEKYFARILKAHGYTVAVDKLLEGHCIRHEVDVTASKNTEQCVIECKYHSDAGNSTDVKTALYVHSRVEDIRKAFERLPENKDRSFEGWLVTNTRCTPDAIAYAACVGLKIISWKYPENRGLENMIEDKRLYPVTVLPAARQRTLAQLFSRDFILVQDISDTDRELFVQKSGLDAETAYNLKKQAAQLCPGCG